MGIAFAPPGVLAAMTTGSAICVGATIDVVSIPVRAYPAATADLGPDRDGGLVDASRLPNEL